jgi:hypothetical protein
MRGEKENERGIRPPPFAGTSGDRVTSAEAELGRGGTGLCDRQKYSSSFRYVNRCWLNRLRVASIVCARPATLQNSWPNQSMSRLHTVGRATFSQRSAERRLAWNPISRARVATQSPVSPALPLLRGELRIPNSDSRGFVSTLG